MNDACEHDFQFPEKPEPGDPLFKKVCTKCGDVYECPHSKVMPEFDEQEAEGLDTAEIRRRWPRFYGPCPDCGESMILYASVMHYIMGDW